MLLQAQKRKLGLLDDEDTSNLEESMSNKKQKSGENLSNNRGLLGHCYIRFGVTKLMSILDYLNPVSHFSSFCRQLG